MDDAIRSAKISSPNATKEEETHEMASAEVNESRGHISMTSKRGRANDKRRVKPTCDICGKTFTRKHHVTVHMKYHIGVKAYECDVCNKRFDVSNSLKIHRRLHTTERPCSCDMCGYACNESGKLRIHKRRHTGERPYPCDVCEKRFTIACSLKKHKELHTGEKPFECRACGKRYALIGSPMEGYGTERGPSLGNGFP